MRNSNTNEINDTIVWSLKVLSDHTLISGDSLGHVQFWDGYTGSLISSFSQHTADVVALEFNEKENIVFASGVDHKVVMLRLVENGSSGQKQWKYCYAHRAHTHDVKCLAIGRCNVYDGSSNKSNISRGSGGGKDTNRQKKRKRTNDKNSQEDLGQVSARYTRKEIIFSGGIDTQICYYNVNKFETTRPRKICPYPQQNNIFEVCREKRLLLSRFETRIKIWKLKDTSSNSNEDTFNEKYGGFGSTPGKKNSSEEQILLYDIDVSETCRGMHTTCSCMSLHGKYLLVGFQNGLRMFKLDIKKGSIAAVKLPQQTPAGGVLSVKFSPCNKRFVYATDHGAIHVGYISNKDSITFATMKTLPHQLYNGHMSNEKAEAALKVAPITMMSISLDSQWVAVGVLSTNSIYVYSLDSTRYHSTIPTTKNQFTSFEFIGNTVNVNAKRRRVNKNVRDASSGTIHLIVTCVHNDFCLYDIDESRMSWWHRANPMEMLPKQFTNRREKIVGVVNMPEEPDVVIMYTMNYFIKVDFAQDLPSNKQDIIVYENRMNRRNRNTKDAVRDASKLKNFRLTDRYRPILHVDYLSSPNELVIVERPWVKILQEFANPLKLKRYGAD